MMKPITWKDFGLSAIPYFEIPGNNPNIFPFQALALPEALVPLVPPEPPEPPEPLEPLVLQVLQVLQVLVARRHGAWR